ncbi:MAG: hypothetical protein PHH08_02155 [Candidatus ainarchaeum sp.]|nr:hypothetical protein [Candidatus ainarchaeum sp.]
MQDGKIKRICSQCGSENLKQAVTPWKGMAGPLIGQYKCLDCGFEGIPIETGEKSAERIREKLLLKNKKSKI